MLKQRWGRKALATHCSSLTTHRAPGDQREKETSFVRDLLSEDVSFLAKLQFSLNAMCESRGPRME